MACSNKEVEVERVVELADPEANLEYGYAGNLTRTSKYRWWNFLPLTLWEQFHRLANIYFLMIAILQQIPDVSPLGGGTTAMTLCVVLGFTAIKEAFEDRKRHKLDKEVNNTLTEVLSGSGGASTPIKWRDVMVGQVLKINIDEDFPADLLVLATSEPQGMCYINTANLDGETNLKIRQALSETNEEDAYSLRGTLTCDPPNPDMYSFNGKLEVGSETYALANNQVVLRGAKLKNTRWIHGLVVYTGMETKLNKSAVKPRAKISKVEKTTNSLIIILLLVQILMCILSAVLYGNWLAVSATDHTYLAVDDLDPVGQGFLSFLTFVILFSNLIPISLYVSMETIKFGQSYFIDNDLNMYYAEKNMPARAQTSTIHEELGQIDYVFSDKTGTLTRNLMEFAKCSVAGVAYGKATNELKRGEGAASPSQSRRGRGPSGQRGPRGSDNRRGGGGSSYNNSYESWEYSTSSTLADWSSSSLVDRTLSPASVPVRRRGRGNEGSAAPGYVPVTLPTSRPPMDSSSSSVWSDEYDGESIASALRDSQVLDAPGRGGDRSRKRKPKRRYGGGDNDAYDDRPDSIRVAAADPGGRNGRDTLPPAPREGREGERYPEVADNHVNETYLGQKTDEVPHVAFVDDGGRFAADLGSPDSPQQERLLDFLEVLGVCHTVIPEPNEDVLGGIEYQAASPDEGALVWAATYFGFEFHSRNPKEVTCRVMGVDKVYKILNVNEFNSTRKRMSVVARCPDGKIRVLCKGADTMIYDVCLDRSAPWNQQHMGITQAHLNSFAVEGLRTLALSSRVLSEDEYREWAAKYHAASILIEGRKAALAEVGAEIEQQMTLVGATAIEDKLQDGVPETIKALRRAGIRVWVLTGDKFETAVMIGYSCQLLSHDGMELLPIISNPDDDMSTAERQEEISTKLDEYLATVKSKKDMDLEPPEFAMVVDGFTLKLLLGGPGNGKPVPPKAGDQHYDDLQRRYEENLAEWEANKTLAVKLMELASQCKSVIGCRVSPAQKAQVVEFVMKNLPVTPVTLSIGDGANDVEMIKKASIGIGISGEEGQQAAQNSDYAIGQFKYLAPLCLVHGRWNYHRTSKLILYSFYKNAALAMIPFWFQFYAGFSGQSFSEKWTFSLYNVLFTSLPILVVGILDQDIPRETLLAFPELYKSGPKNRFFTRRAFMGWWLVAVFHSAVIFMGVVFCLDRSVIHGNGQVVGLWTQGTFVMTVVVLVVSYKVCLVTNRFTWLNAVCLALSVPGYFLWLIVYQFIGKLWLDAADFFYVGFRCLSSWQFWFLCVSLPVVALLPDYIFKVAKRTYFPEAHDLAREIPVRQRQRRQSIHPDVVVGGMQGVIPSGFVYDPSPDGHVEMIFDRSYPATGLEAVRSRPRAGSWERKK